MNLFKIKGTTNVEIGQLKQKIVRFSGVNKLVDKTKSELRLERLHIQLGKTKEEINQNHTPSQWFNEWEIDGGEKGRIKSCQSEARNNKYDDSNEAAFFYY